MLSKVVLALAFGAASAANSPVSDFLTSEAFEHFKADFGKVYASAEEEAARFAIFASTVERIVALNAEAKDEGFSVTHGINQFADLTETEFASQYLNLVIPEDFELNATVATISATPLSGTFDWRTPETGKTPLTAVKDQAQCGSCWAFSATETIESAWALAGHDLTEFSPQQIVSCDTAGQDQGCSGGFPSGAFDYVKGAGGMATAASYPYTSLTGNSGTCKKFTTDGGVVTGYTYATPQCTKRFGTCTQDENTLGASMKASGPVSIVVDASQWQTYKSGVFPSSKCSSSLRKMDHAVQLVAFNADDSTPYWTIRNSWAATWGEEGFIRVSLGDNACGLANIATNVQVTK